MDGGWVVLSLPYLCREETEGEDYSWEKVQAEKRWKR